MEGGSEGGTEDYFFKFVQTLKVIDLTFTIFLMMDLRLFLLLLARQVLVSIQKIHCYS